MKLSRAIQVAEKKLEALTAESTLPENLSDAKRLAALTEEMGQIQSEIDRLYLRWSELGS